MLLVRRNVSKTNERTHIFFFTSILLLATKLVCARAGWRGDGIATSSRKTKAALKVYASGCGGGLLLDLLCSWHTCSRQESFFSPSGWAGWLAAQTAVQTLVRRCGLCCHLSSQQRPGGSSRLLVASRALRASLPTSLSKSHPLHLVCRFTRHLRKLGR